MDIGWARVFRKFGVLDLVAGNCPGTGRARDNDPGPPLAQLRSSSCPARDCCEHFGM